MSRYKKSDAWVEKWDTQYDYQKKKKTEIQIVSQL